MNSISITDLMIKDNPAQFYAEMDEGYAYIKSGNRLYKVVAYKDHLEIICIKICERENGEMREA